MTARKSAIQTATADLAALGWVLNPKTLCASYAIKGMGSIHLRYSDPREYGRDMLTVRALKVHRLDLASAAADLAAASNYADEVRAILDTLHATLAR